MYAKKVYEYYFPNQELDGFLDLWETLLSSRTEK
jgi:hypothetical protein